MNFLRYLASKRTDYFYSSLLFFAASVCLSQGVNESTRFLVYCSGFFIYFLIRRLNLWENALVGLALGASYGYFTFLWLSRFADFTAFNLAIAFNGLMVSVMFVFAYFLYKTFPRTVFVQVFGLSVGIFVMRLIFHYSPFLAYAKAFLTIVNTTTVFDWLVPYFGSSITDILVLSTGSLGALLYLETKKKKISQVLYIYIVLFIILLAVPLLNTSPTRSAIKKQESVKVALLQGNFNWSWEDRLNRSDEIFRYYSAETKKAARKGAKIVVWPEYAVPVDVLHDRRDIGEKLAALSIQENVVIVTGSLELVTDVPNPNAKWTGYDVSLVFDPKKILLDPYRAVHPISKNVKVGTKRVMFNSQYATFPVISCFEVAYHKFVADYSNLDQPFDFFIGIANIQLFLETDGAKRIENHIRRIAMENGKYFIYVSNTGPSLVISPTGHLDYRIPSLIRESPLVDVPKIKEVSFYARYQDLPLTILYIGSFGTIFILRRRSR